jgi:putative endonuclease
MMQKRQTNKNNRLVGSQQEAKAENFLIVNGYDICEKNFFCRTGEIDIIAKDQEYLVFVEVKFRSSLEKGAPEDAITHHKMHQIIETARYYMYKNRIPEDTPCRFDVVVILNEEIRLIKDAFMVNE